MFSDSSIKKEDATGWDAKKGHLNIKVTDCAQAGAPLISMSHTLKLSSTMKSNPKSWKLW